MPTKSREHTVGVPALIYTGFVADPLVAVPTLFATETVLVVNATVPVAAGSVMV